MNRFLQEKTKTIARDKTTKFDKELINAQNELRIIAYRLTANKEKAEDLVQETFLKLLENEKTTFGTYRFSLAASFSPDLPHFSNPRQSSGYLGISYAPGIHRRL